MKKITLMAFSFATTMAFAQYTGTASGVTQLGEDKQAVILDQTEDGANTIVSCTNTGQTATVLCADDFTITQDTRIDLITIRGTVNNGLAANITGWDLYIFNDTAGSPGEDPTNTAGAPLVIQNASGAGITLADDGVSAVDVSFDIATLAGADLELAPGTYWVSAGPIMNITDILDNTAAGERYNWDSSSDFNGAEPHLIDVNDTFGGGFTTYTPFSTLGVTVGALAFTVEGETILSVDDQILSQISVFPNPVNDVLNLKVPSSISIENITLYDILGKNTGATIVNGEINVSELARGVYILNVETNAGTLTQKIVKQ